MFDYLALFLSTIIQVQIAPKPLTIDLVWVEGPYATHAADRAEIARQTRAYYQEIGIKLKVRPRVLVDDPCPEYRQLANWQQRIFCYGRTRTKGSRRVTLFVGPPIVEADGKRYVGGNAFVCQRWGYGQIHGQSVNQDGVDRTPFTYTTIAHELGHILGAGHHNAPFSLMHSSALAYVNAGLRVPEHPESVRQIRACFRLRKWS